jgi:hypothetical protein
VATTVTPDAIANSIVPLLVCSALVCGQMNTSALCTKPVPTEASGKCGAAQTAMPHLKQMQQIRFGQETALELDRIAYSE